MRIVILLVLMGGWPGLLQAATVYRCDLPDGRVGFSDRPCEGGGGQGALSGWNGGGDRRAVRVLRHGIEHGVTIT